MIKKRCIMRSLDKPKPNSSYRQIDLLLKRRSLEATVNIEYEGELYSTEVLNDICSGDVFSFVVEGENEITIVDMLVGRFDEQSQIISTKEVIVINRLGLHARATPKIGRLTCILNADIILERGDDDDHLMSGVKVSIDSPLGLIMLAAEQGTRLKISAYGPEAIKAVEMVSSVIENGFGELE